MARKNIFRSALDGMVEARRRQAGAYVAGYLLSLDDETLARSGYSRDAVRAGRIVAR